MRAAWPLLFVLLAGVPLACSSDEETEGLAAAGAGQSSTAGRTTVPIGGTGSSSGGTSSSAGGGTYELPPDFTAAEIGSGWKLGTLVEGNEPPGTGECNNQLTGIVRDFHADGTTGGHPDFEMDLDQFMVMTGMVESEIGSNRKPVLTEPGLFATGPDEFDQWYLTGSQNQAFYLTLFLVPRSDNVFSFQSGDFFPLDDAGFGNERNDHNFHFTFELHTTFVYHGGETFTFIGDDDVWVFINGELAVDIGGVHPEATDSVDLDDQARDLGITIGSTYDLDMFHAERHTFESNFRIDTTLEFTNCGEFVDDVPR